jgi:predicted enzyme related to lactoylglutathione lyase
MVPPMDVTDVGRMAVFVDTGNAVFGAWQPRAFKGAAVVNEPDTWCWSELLTRQPDAAKAFYPAVFGWTINTNPMGDAGEYTEWQVDGRTIAGMMEMDPANFPAQIPPHWNLYFAVADCQAAAAKVAELGGQVMVPPTTIPIGTFSVCMDPQGANFSIIQLADGSPS